MSDHQDSVLVVDDEVLIAHLWCMTLEDMGLKVCGTAATAENAISMAREHRPRVVLMDVRLRGALDGVDAALAIHEQVGSKLVFITGSKEKATLERIQQDHPMSVLFKPVSDRLFKAAVKAAMEA
jgi:DNA-binding NarL/FixJ family response regulator